MTKKEYLKIVDIIAGIPNNFNNNSQTEIVSYIQNRVPKMSLGIYNDLCILLSGKPLNYVKSIRNTYLSMTLFRFEKIDSSLLSINDFNTLMDVFAEICFDVKGDSLRDMLKVVEDSSKSFNITLDNNKNFEEMNVEEKMLFLRYCMKYDRKKLIGFAKNKRDFRADLYDAISFIKERSIKDINKRIYKLNKYELNPELNEKYNAGDIKVYDASKQKKPFLLHSSFFDRKYNIYDLDQDLSHEQQNTEINCDVNDYNSLVSTKYGSKCFSVVCPTKPVTYKSVSNKIQFLYGEIDPELVFTVCPYDGYSITDISKDNKYGIATSVLLPIYATCSDLVKASLKNRKTHSQMNEISTVIINDNSIHRGMNAKAILCYNEITEKETMIAKKLGLPIVYAECEKEFDTNHPKNVQQGIHYTGTHYTATENDFLLDL